MTEEVHVPEGSVLHGHPEFDWSASDAVRCEVALEMLGLLAAACTERITREQSKPSPAAAVIEDWRRRRMAYVAQQTELASSDATAIDDILHGVTEQLAGIEQRR